jgi:hypothetical protein
LGVDADTYTSKVQYVTDEPYLPRRTANVPVSVYQEGFAPFGVHIEPITAYEYPQYLGRLDEHGAQHRWSSEMIPSGAVTLLPHSWTAKSVTGFGFGGMQNFPVPDFFPIDDFGIQYARAGRVVREYDKEQAQESRVVDMRWRDIDESECRSLLTYLLEQVRTNNFALNFGDGLARLAPWRLRDWEVSGPYTVRLASGGIDIRNDSGNLWSVGIRVRKEK